MITISPEAEEFFHGIECPEGKVLRLEATLDTSGKHHASFTIGYPKDDDEVLVREGETLLRVSRLACETFDGFVVTRLEVRGGRYHFVATLRREVLLVTGSGGRDTEASPARKSTREIESEIAWLLEEITRIEVLEDMAKKRHALEQRSETEGAYRWRRKQVERIRRRYRWYIKEFGRRCSL